MKREVKKELSQIYITTDGNKYFDIKSAQSHQNAIDIRDSILGNGFINNSLREP